MVLVVEEGDLAHVMVSLRLVKMKTGIILIALLVLLVLGEFVVVLPIATLQIIVLVTYVIQAKPVMGITTVTKTRQFLAVVQIVIVVVVVREIVLGTMNVLVITVPLFVILIMIPAVVAVVVLWVLVLAIRKPLETSVPCLAIVVQIIVRKVLAWDYVLHIL